MFHNKSLVNSNRSWINRQVSKYFGAKDRQQAIRKGYIIPQERMQPSRLEKDENGNWFHNIFIDPRK